MPRKTNWNAGTDLASHHFMVEEACWNATSKSPRLRPQKDGAWSLYSFSGKRRFALHRGKGALLALFLRLMGVPPSSILMKVVSFPLSSSGTGNQLPFCCRRRGTDQWGKDRVVRVKKR